MNRVGSNRLRVWLVILGVFALGCVTGALLDGAYRLQASSSGRPETHAQRGGAEETFEVLKRDLDLSEQQATEIRVIVEQTREGFRELRAECRPRFDTIRQNSRSRIRALLTPAQQQRFDRMLAEEDARRIEKEKNKP